MTVDGPEWKGDGVEPDVLNHIRQCAEDAARVLQERRPYARPELLLSAGENEMIHFTVASREALRPNLWEPLALQIEHPHAAHEAYLNAIRAEMSKHAGMIFWRALPDWTQEADFATSTVLCRAYMRGSMVEVGWMKGPAVDKRPEPIEEQSLVYAASNG